MDSVSVPLRVASAANVRQHWGTRARTAKRHRTLAWAAVSPVLLRARARLVASLEGRGLTVRLVRVAPRSLDTDNLAAAFKSVRDGVTDALKAFGVRDDADPRVRWEYAQERGAPRAYAMRIEVTA